MSADKKYQNLQKQLKKVAVEGTIHKMKSESSLVNKFYLKLIKKRA